MRRQRQQTTSRASSHVRQPERAPEKDCLEHFERFCHALRLQDTLKPFVLEEYQLEALQDYFSHGALEHLWEWPTGMGKSTLLGALCLHHATYVRINPRVIILGGYGGHGKHTLRAASWFVSQNAMLRQWFVPQEYGMGRIKSLIAEDVQGVILVSSAGQRKAQGGTSQEGETPSLIVVEELHRHEDNGAAVRTLTSKVQKRTVGRHRVRIVHVTTAGDVLDSPLGRMEKRALSGQVSRPKPDLYYARAEDAEGDLVMHQYAVPERVEPPQADATPDELDAYLTEVKKANPASFITKKNLRRSWKASSSEPWVFQRQHANQWVVQYQSAFSRYNWTQCATPGILIPRDARGVVVALDTGLNWSSTAIIPVWVSEFTDTVTTAGGVILSSEDRTGTHRRIRDAIDVIESMRELWPDLRVVFDRNMGGGLIAEEFEEDHGLDVIDHGQGVPMEFSSMLLGELIAQHLLHHDDQDEVTAHVLACAARPTFHGRRWRIDKPRSGEPIDAAVALAMGVWVAYQENQDRVRLEDWHITSLESDES